MNTMTCPRCKGNKAINCNKCGGAGAVLIGRDAIPHSNPPIAFRSPSPIPEASTESANFVAADRKLRILISNYERSFDSPDLTREREIMLQALSAIAASYPDTEAGRLAALAKGGIRVQVTPDERERIEAFRLVDSLLDAGASFEKRLRDSLNFSKAVQEAREMRAYFPGTLRTLVIENAHR